MSNTDRKNKTKNFFFAEKFLFRKKCKKKNNNIFQLKQKIISRLHKTTHRIKKETEKNNWCLPKIFRIQNIQNIQNPLWISKRIPPSKKRMICVCVIPFRVSSHKILENFFFKKKLFFGSRFSSSSSLSSWIKKWTAATAAVEIAVKNYCPIFSFREYKNWW